MQLVFSDRCEQGTPKGVMLFRKGATYSAVPNPDGSYTVTHEPREERQRVEGKRVLVPVSQTTIPAALLDQLLAHGPVTKQE